MKKIMYMMMGVPGAGKSTYIKNNLAGVKVVSRDAIRFSVLEDDENYFAKEGIVWQIFVDEAQVCLDRQEDFVLDATHLNEASRKKILRALKINRDIFDIKLIFINTSFETCIKRNARRTGRAFVPELSIANMYAHLAKPHYSEGFDEITEIKED